MHKRTCMLYSMQKNSIRWWWFVTMM